MTVLATWLPSTTDTALTKVCQRHQANSGSASKCRRTPSPRCLLQPGKTGQKKAAGQGRCKTHVHGTLDVADDDADELFGKLAHFLLFQRLRVVFVQHLQPCDVGSVKQSSLHQHVSARVAPCAGPGTKEWHHLEEEFGQVGRRRIYKQLFHLFPFVLAVGKGTEL